MIKLLVIDDDGYQWYKNHERRIDPLAANANLTR